MNDLKPIVVPDWKLIVLCLRHRTGLSYRQLAERMNCPYHILKSISSSRAKNVAMKWSTGQILIAAARTELTDEQLARCRVGKS